MDLGQVNKSKTRAILAALKAISDETRLRILHILSFGALNVQEITEALSMGQSRISRHLKILADAELLTYQREGSWVYYSLLRESSVEDFPKDLTDLLLAYKEDLPMRAEDQKSVSEVLANREQKSRKYFNQLGSDWEGLQKNVMEPSLYRKKILSVLPDSLDTILDFGCGPGGLIPYLLGRAKNVIGFDSSATMVEEAQKQFASNPNVEIFQSNLESISEVNPESADAIVASMVLHHISNPTLVLQEAYRLLKPGGTLCIVDLKKHTAEHMRESFADLWLGFDPALLSEWLEDAHFSVETEEEVDTDSEFKVLILKAQKIAKQKED